MKGWVLFGFFALLIVGCGSGTLEGAPAPELSLTDLKTGQKLSLADFKSKPVVIDFWETWCEPCRQMMPEVENLSKEYAAKGVRVLGVSDETQEEVKKFVYDRGLTYQFGLDPDGKTREKFHIDGFPTMVVIDKNGKVIYQDTPPEIEKVRQILDRTLANS